MNLKFESNSFESYWYEALDATCLHASFNLSYEARLLNKS